jgi:hypothetical protein
MTEAAFETLAEAADDLGGRVVRAHVEETGRKPEGFDISPED